MTQGPVKNTSSGGKIEPMSHAVDEGAVGWLGLAQGIKGPPLYEGRGLEAPKAMTTIHDCGSQGKHK